MLQPETAEFERFAIIGNVHTGRRTGYALNFGTEPTRQSGEEADGNEFHEGTHRRTGKEARQAFEMGS
jgi:hypothetical protein